MDPATALGKMTEIVKWEPEGNGQKKRTALWDNLDAASRMLIPNKPGDLIVVVSDGGDNMSTVHEEKVQKELLSADVSLIAMIVASPFSAIPEEGDSLGALLELVKATGGTVRVAGLTVLGKDPEVIVPVRPGELIAQLAHQYELEVDEPLIEKPEKWQLSVGPLESGRTVQPFYRRYLLPCRATP
jgi:hypothetical protein